ncbi:deoxycytidyl transferase [Boothiomyces macroporosus]|uniref:DNA repair protein REV1 n=1 Tax=Boothiomyces macroporosus TaxID=261099 RepID=A0AAD5UFP8_9FUNG|nr:deoxycytidyl transferase [Boothiomyces macroporosus]
MVNSDWLVDSLNANKLLDWKKYSLRKAENPISFASVKSRSLSLTGESDIDVLQDIDSDNESIDLGLLASQKGNQPLERKKPMDSSCPGFIKTYFEHSRLHFLSTWKQDLVFEIAEKIKTKPVPKTTNRIVFHIDMDCFFVSVILRKYPQYNDKPVVVAHSEKGDENSTSEIASCNYVARKYGITNGSFVGRAKELCQDLVVLPYDFEEIKQCTTELYNVLYENSDYMQAISCDEAVIDVSTVIKDHTPESSLEYAEFLRTEIKAKTGCNASVGIGPNPLLARLAVNFAKPNSKYFLDDIESVLDTPVGKLPGVGYQAKKKFASIDIHTIKDLQTLQVGKLKQIFGEKNGSAFYNIARGIDTRTLQNKARQTIGSDVNWGIRFKTQDQLEIFMKEFADEVFKRMKQAGLNCNHLTVKLKERDYAGEPWKFLGCGKCKDYSKAVNLDRIANSGDVIYKNSMNIINSFKIPVQELRGIGLHLKENGKVDIKQPKLDFTKRKPKTKVANFKRLKVDFPAVEVGNIPDYLIPSFSQIDPQIFKLLPKQIQKEQEELAKLKKKPIKKRVESKIAVFLDETCVKTITGWILEWCEMLTDIPDTLDMKLVIDYLHDLVDCSDMENCLTILQLIRNRLIKKNGKGPAWKSDTFMEIYNSVDDFIYSKYSNRLRLLDLD